MTSELMNFSQLGFWVCMCVGGGGGGEGVKKMAS